MQIQSFTRSSSYVYHWYMVRHNVCRSFAMGNPIKNWFFELIEDAIGSKAMQQFKKEEEDKNDQEVKGNNKK